MSIYENKDNSYKCYYHPVNTLTNFCINPNCLLPMCPECVNQHLFFHNSNNTKAEFISLSVIFEDINTKFQGDYKNKLENFKRSYKDYPDLLRNRLLEIKTKLIDEIDDFFEGLRQELFELNQYQFIQFEKNLKIIENQFQTNCEKFENYFKNCFVNNQIGGLIELNSSNFFEKQNNIFIESNSRLNLIQNQVLDILFDENSIGKIKKELVKSISIKNKDLFQSKNSLILDNKQIEKETLNKIVKSRNSSIAIANSVLYDPINRTSFSNTENNFSIENEKKNYIISPLIGSNRNFIHIRNPTATVFKENQLNTQISPVNSKRKIFVTKSPKYNTLPTTLSK